MDGSGKNNFRLITAEQIRAWGRSLLSKFSVSEEGADDILDVLLQSNLRGVDTHGIIRVIDYAKRLQNTSCGKIEIVKDGKGSALVDGHNNPGPVVGKFSMNLAIEKAREHGMGCVCARNSNHFSTCAYYSMMASENEMIGIVLSTASPRIAPWEGLDAVIGNNPWSISLPGYTFPIVLDMANTVVAMGKIRTCLREGKPLEPGWAMDSEGNPTTDPVAANSGLLMPIGAHKGVAISMMVDLLCVTLAQSVAFSNDVKRVEDSSNPQNSSHIFAAVDFKDLIDVVDLKAYIKRYADIVKSVRRKDGCQEIFLPGEIEWNTFCTRSRGGIPLSNKTIEQLNAFAKSVESTAL